MSKRQHARGLGRSAHDHESIVSRVDEFIRSSIQHKSFPEICQALGLSRRTVERAFREQHHTSPARYLRISRMMGARSDLLKGAGSVRGIAARHGFYDAGRFAARYKQMFGEYPSETLVKSKQRQTLGWNRKSKR